MRASLLAPLAVLALMGGFVVASGPAQGAVGPSVSSSPAATSAAIAAAEKKMPGLSRSDARSLLSQRTAAPVGPAAQMQAAETPQASTIRAVLHGDPVAVAGVVTAAGGTVLASTADAVSAIVPTASSAKVAASKAITSVTRPELAYEDSDAGTVASQVSAWTSAGDTGQGVTIAIIDGGFGSLTVPTADNHCANSAATKHGQLVAAVVAEMAPGATLRYYCVDDNFGFEQAGTQLIADGAKIATTSLSFPGDSRGDGSGGAHSVDTTVETIRKAGVLVTVAAGNYGTHHYGGTLADADGDGIADLVDPNNEDDLVTIDPGRADLVLQYDAWPVSSAQVILAAGGYQCLDALCNNTTPINADPSGNPGLVHNDQVSGQIPVLDIPVINSSAFPQLWDVFVPVGSSMPGLKYDLTYFGSIDPAPSLLALDNPTQGLAGSITAPANSPYAFAVGAEDVSGTNACHSDSALITGLPYPLEAYSSSGPTIDTRTKPDIVAYDGIASSVDSSVLCGTSFSTPYVAGAAAVVASANSSLDASQIESLLEQRAASGAPKNPPAFAIGYGNLTLGATTGVTAPVGAAFTPLAAPDRILNTSLPSSPTHGQPLTPHGSPVTLTIPPSDLAQGATAVAINLTGAQAAGPTFLSVFSADLASTDSSNLNLNPPYDGTAAVFAIVTLGAGNQIKISDASFGANVHAIVDVVGSFGPQGPSTPDLYQATAPTRLLDTRPTTAAPGHKGQIADGQVVTVTPTGLPPNTTAIAVNVTSATAKGSGLFTLAPTDPGGDQTSTLNYSGPDRANLTIVTLAPDGSFVVRGAGAPADAVIDLVGAFTSAGGGSKYVSLPAPVRIVDTRFGNGGQLAPLRAGSQLPVFAAGLNGVPYSASAVLVGLVAQAAGASFFALFPDTPQNVASPPNVSTVNFTTDRIVANAAFATVDPTTKSTIIYNAAGSSQAIMDLFGYFN